MLPTDIKNAECPVCCSRDLNGIFSLYDDRYGYPGLFQIAACSQCGHKFAVGDFTPELLRTLYTDYYPRSAYDLTRYRPSPEVKGFMAWLNGEKRSAYCWVPKNVRVLDIGCGFGETLGYHLARGCEVHGVEADENILRVSEKFNFNVRTGLFDPDAYEPAFFDFVTMDQVIEHTTDPVATMRGIARVLKPGGTAILSTPNPNGWGPRVFGSNWINWHVPYHLQFFSKTSMKLAAGKAGLVVECAKSITSSEWLFYQWIHLLTRPPMGERSAFWSPKGARTLKVKLLFGILLAMHYTKINHIITRLFDALGIGDNYLFILKKT